MTTPSPRVGIVWNPSKIEKSELQEVLDGRVSGELVWFETTEKDPGQGPAREARDSGCELVLVAGGDGTVRAVAEVLAGTGIHLGIIPQGTGNLLARNLDVPLGDVGAAVDRALDSESAAIDLGWVDIEGESDPRAFAVMVGFGIDAQMLAETDDDLKDKAGWLAYAEAIGRAVSESEVVELGLTVDDGVNEDVRAHTVLVGNCGMVQGGIKLLPHAQIDDGRLDLLVVSAESPRQWLDTIRAVFAPNGAGSNPDEHDGNDDAGAESADFRTAARLRIELPSPQLLEIDGEEVGEVTAFTVRCDPGALLVR